MQLVIAEKPSVAMSIAKVLGVKNRQNGYMEGNGYIISWCVGHLVGLVSPEFYDEKYKKWDMEDLPIFPKEFKYYVLPKVKKQFSILKTLMNRKDINEVINACDAGREGELIFRLVYKQAKCKKDIKRLWISSMEDRAIKEGFEKLKEGQDYDNLFASATARAKADWLVGMNLSRLYSLLYKQNYSVGRVQTPTLALMVEREGDIQSFKKEKYYTVELNLDDFSLTTERIDNPDIAEQLKNLVPETIKIDYVEEKEKITKPDLLKSQFKNSENHNSGMMNNTKQELLKSQGNNTNINKTDYSNTDFNNTTSIFSKDKPIEELKRNREEDLKEKIKDNISYEKLITTYPNEEGRIDLILSLVTDLLINKNPLKINGIYVNHETVKEKFLDLEFKHIVYVLDYLNKVPKKQIKSLKAYLLTILFNADENLKLEGVSKRPDSQDDITYDQDARIWKEFLNKS